MLLKTAIKDREVYVKYYLLCFLNHTTYLLFFFFLRQYSLVEFPFLKILVAIKNRNEQDVKEYFDEDQAWQLVQAKAKLAAQILYGQRAKMASLTVAQAEELKNKAERIGDEELNQ